MTDDRPPEFVAAVALMDKHFLDWRTKTDPVTLNLSSLDTCIICQQDTEAALRGGFWTETVEKTFGLDREGRGPFGDNGYLRFWLDELNRKEDHPNAI